MPDPLSSLEAYQTFIYTLSEYFPTIRRSTLVYVPSGDLFGVTILITAFGMGVGCCIITPMRKRLEVGTSTPHITSAIMPGVREIVPVITH
jgi:hypothetical protein